MLFRSSTSAGRLHARARPCRFEAAWREGRRWPSWASLSPPFALSAGRLRSLRARGMICECGAGRAACTRTQDEHADCRFEAARARTTLASGPPSPSASTRRLRARGPFRVQRRMWCMHSNADRACGVLFRGCATPPPLPLRVCVCGAFSRTGGRFFRVRTGTARA